MNLVFVLHTLPRPLSWQKSAREPSGRVFGTHHAVSGVLNLLLPAAGAALLIIASTLKKQRSPEKILIILRNKKGPRHQSRGLSPVNEVLCSFHCAGVNALQLADRAVLEYGRSDRDETYKAPIPDRTLILQEVHERKDGKPDYYPHSPFVVEHTFCIMSLPPVSSYSIHLFLFYQSPLLSATS